MHASLTTAALLAGTTLSLAQTSSPPPYNVEQAFGLVARITKQATSGTPLAIEGYRLASGHVGAGEDASVLIPSSGGPLGLEPDTYYGNGTTEQITYGSGSVVRTPTGEYPYAIVINGAPNATAGHQVSVDIGDGTFGVGVFGVSYTGPGQPDSQPFLGYRPLGSYGGEDQFYACNGPFYQYTVPLLYWRNETSVTPEDCAEIKLLPQCAGDVVNATQYTQKVSCYDDAASVPVLN